MTYEYEILTELRAINGMLVKILEAMQERQSVPGPGDSINVNWNFDSCDHEWVPNDGLCTAVEQYHCAKCGVIRGRWRSLDRSLGFDAESRKDNKF